MFIIYSLRVFYISNLSDSMSLQVSRTFLSILADLNNTVVWMSSTRPLIFKTSSFCTNPLVTILRVPITTCITVTFRFHSFFYSQAKSLYLFFISISFHFILAETVKFTILQVLFSFSFFFFLIITRSGRLAEIR